MAQDDTQKDSFQGPQVPVDPAAVVAKKDDGKTTNGFPNMFSGLQTDVGKPDAVTGGSEITPPDKPLVTSFMEKSQQNNTVMGEPIPERQKGDYGTSKVMGEDVPNSAPLYVGPTNVPSVFTGPDASKHDANNASPVTPPPGISSSHSSQITPGQTKAGATINNPGAEVITSGFPRSPNTAGSTLQPGSLDGVNAVMGTGSNGDKTIALPDKNGQQQFAGFSPAPGVDNNPADTAAHSAQANGFTFPDAKEKSSGMSDGMGFPGQSMGGSGSNFSGRPQQMPDPPKHLDAKSGIGWKERIALNNSMDANYRAQMEAYGKDSANEANTSRVESHMADTGVQAPYSRIDPAKMKMENMETQQMGIIADPKSTDAQKRQAKETLMAIRGQNIDKTPPLPRMTTMETPAPDGVGMIKTPMVEDPKTGQWNKITPQFTPQDAIAEISKDPKMLKSFRDLPVDQQNMKLQQIAQLHQSQQSGFPGPHIPQQQAAQ